jgi:hypothetical protein
MCAISLCHSQPSGRPASCRQPLYTRNRQPIDEGSEVNSITRQTADRPPGTISTLPPLADSPKCYMTHRWTERDSNPRSPSAEIRPVDRARAGTGPLIRNWRRGPGPMLIHTEGKDQKDDEQQPGQGHLNSNGAAVHDRNRLHQVCSHRDERPAIGQRAVCAAPAAPSDGAGPLGRKARWRAPERLATNV